jgi:hypothetical protein
MTLEKTIRYNRKVKEDLTEVYTIAHRSEDSLFKDVSFPQIDTVLVKSEWKSHLFKWNQQADSKTYKDWEIQ